MVAMIQCRRGKVARVCGHPRLFEKAPCGQRQNQQSDQECHAHGGRVARQTEAGFKDTRQPPVQDERAVTDRHRVDRIDRQDVPVKMDALGG